MQELLNMSTPERRVFTREVSQTTSYYIHDIYFDGSLGAAHKYREEMDLIRNMGEDDILYCRYNGTGGDAFTMIQFIRCFQECKGTIIGSVEGDCESAYTFMFLQSHGFEISDHCKFMCHNYNGGLIGSGHEIWQEAQFDKGWGDNLIKDLYADFLTEEEMERLLTNHIYYFSPEEVLERCQSMVDARKARDAELEKTCEEDCESCECKDTTQELVPET